METTRFTRWDNFRGGDRQSRFHRELSLEQLHFERMLSDECDSKFCHSGDGTWVVDNAHPGNSHRLVNVAVAGVWGADNAHPGNSQRLVTVAIAGVLAHTHLYGMQHRINEINFARHKALRRGLGIVRHNGDGGAGVERAY